MRFVENINVNAGLCVEIKKAKSKRSLRQNALLHKWLSVIAEERYEAGYQMIPMLDWKEYFRDCFLTPEIIEIQGKIVTKKKSTTKLSIKEMTSFLEKIEFYAGSELKINLPHPEDLGRDYSR